MEAHTINTNSIVMKPGRSLVEGQIVKCYLNWNRGWSVFSIVNKKSGLVCAYAERVLLRNAQFYVSSKGRDRVRRDKCKNVHSWCYGEFVAADIDRPAICTSEAFYDPYVTDSFFDISTELPIGASDIFDFAPCEVRRVWVPTTGGGLLV